MLEHNPIPGRRPGTARGHPGSGGDLAAGPGMGREPRVGQQLRELVQRMGRQSTEDILEVREGIDILVLAGSGQEGDRAQRGTPQSMAWDVRSGVVPASCIIHVCLIEIHEKRPVPNCPPIASKSLSAGGFPAFRAVDSRSRQSELSRSWPRGSKAITRRQPGAFPKTRRGHGRQPQPIPAFRRVGPQVLSRSGPKSGRFGPPEFATYGPMAPGDSFATSWPT
jgi:hypothetical protein